MHEILIAVGIGLWFVLCGVVSYVFVCKTYPNKKEDKEKKE